jgi:hypothetical protein
LNKVSTGISSTSAAAALVAGGALTAAGGNLAGTLTSAASSLTNSLTGKASSLTSAASNLTGNALDALKKGVGGLTDMAKELAAGKLGLAALASAGLPAGAAAALAASMNSLSTSSPFPIKMPQVAVGTVDRSEIKSAIASALGSAIVPAPEYDNIPSQADLEAKLSRVNQSIALKEAYYEAAEKLSAAWKIRKAKSLELIEEYKTAKSTLPEGDPEIAAIRARNKPIVDGNNKWYDEEWEKVVVLRQAWFDFNI